METTENISKKGGTLKNTLLAIVGVSALAAGYFAVDLAIENRKLEKHLEEQKFYAERNQRAFSAIESNLAEVSSRAGLITNTSLNEESKSSGTEERIIKEIVFMDKLMNKNREMIKNLTAKLGAKDQRIMKLKKSVADLELRMEEYKTRGNSMSAESQALKFDLQEANIEAAELQQEVADMQKRIEEQDEEIDNKAQMISWQSGEMAKKEIKIRTAYYVVGTYKELSAGNVIEKKGGLAGIGSTKTLKTDFDRKAFHQIDIYSYTSIPVFASDMRILTNHNTGSYELVRDVQGNIQWIKITDPEKFWENSRYLVVAM